jgi:hypothetical protein
MPREISVPRDNSATAGGVAGNHLGDHDIYGTNGGGWGVVAKLRRMIRIQIPVGYEDETGFHVGVEPRELKLSDTGFSKGTNDWSQGEHEL